jgi:aminopeptidase N
MLFHKRLILICSIFLSLNSMAQNYSCQHAKQAAATSTPPYYCAGNLRSDTFDVFKYFINLEIGTAANKFIKGNTVIKFAPKQNNRTFIRFDLLKLLIDSVKEGNTLLTYTYNDTVIKANFTAAKNTNDTSYITVYYHGVPQGDPAGWGGFYFDNTDGANYAYNLGVGFGANPHNYGRCWFPCFDNFVERSRYQFAITSDTTRRAYCNGYLLSDVITLPNRTRTWVMNSEIPSYLASVAVANYRQVNWTVNTLSGPKPITLVSRGLDTTAMKNGFVNLPNCIAGFEDRYGPYIWNRFGYCSVPFNSGAMEHATNISYPKATLGNLAYEANLMAHELSHHWWGDNITCETQEDMWINEGMATYSQYIFTEWQYGKAAYLLAVRGQHDDLLKKLHYKETGFRAISGIPHSLTYGDHVYLKGSIVAHTLRGYLGDTLFFNACKYVQTQNTLKSINSNQLRDLMQTSSGKNLSDFFNNWVFNGGWPHFAIDSVKVLAQASGNYTLQVGVKQKLYGAPVLYNNVPLEISFFKPDWSRTVRKITYSGASQTFTIVIPHAPGFNVLNYDSKISDAVSYEQYTFKTATAITFNRARLRVTVTTVGADSNFMYMAHNFVKADPFKSNPQNALISNQHYWKVGGVWSNGFVAKCRFTFDGTSSWGNTYGKLDTLLTRVNGDSIRLYYRKDATDDWKMVKNFFKNQTGVKTGYIEIDTLKMGEYAFGNHGDTTLAIGVKETDKNVGSLNVFPNPARRLVTVDLNKIKHPYDGIEIMNAEGKLVYSLAVSERSVKLNVENFAKGIYMIQVKDSGKTISTKKLVIE